MVDRFAIEEPEKKALVWCDDNNNEKILTFSELAKQVNKTANVLKSLGIKKGDAVMKNQIPEEVKTKRLMKLQALLLKQQQKLPTLLQPKSPQPSKIAK